MIKHPCFDERAHFKFGRIHLPVAPKCNIQCRYCDRKLHNTDLDRPGVTDDILLPDEAVQRVRKYIDKIPDLTVIGIAGPGEPLANEETFETLYKVNKEFPQLIKCLSTNGLLLPDKIEDLVECGISTITVTVNTTKSSIGKKIYSRVVYNDNMYYDVNGIDILLENQIKGIKLAVEKNLIVKVNTILIPGINDDCIEDIAEKLSKLGVCIMNIVPLIPVGEFKNRKPPTFEYLNTIRDQSDKYVKQFSLCKQCRADAVGIPGKQCRI